MKDHIYYRTMWAYVVAFADMFDDIEVIIYQKDKTAANYGQPIGKISPVPVILAPKEKVISLLNVGGGDRPEVDNILPKISIIQTGLKLDTNRLRGMKEKRDLFTEFRTNSTGNKEIVKNYDLQTVPYIMEMEVTIWAKYLDQAVQMLENILPFFTPDATISIIERGLGTERKSKVELNSVSPNFVYELNEPDKRVIQYQLSFSMEINLYKPIYINKPITDIYIRIANLDTTNRHKAHGETIVVSASGANLYGVDPLILSRIQDLDQITPATGTITAGNTLIEVNSWSKDIYTIAETFDSPQPFQADLHPGELNDEHDPPVKYLFPVARYLAYKYYNSMNPEDQVVPDPDALAEYEAWIRQLEEENDL